MSTFQKFLIMGLVATSPFLLGEVRAAIGLAVGLIAWTFFPRKVTR